MKIHTQNFKDELINLGKQIDSIITYEDTTLHDELYGVNLHYNSNILKSVMKQLDFKCQVDIPINTEINYKFGLKISGTYEYLDYGNFIVTKSEKEEDTKLYNITAYDKMIYAMRQNENLGITYPITIKNYLTQIANGIGLQVKNTTFYNQDKLIQEELYAGLDYTYRDILDEIAQATGSIIVINEDDEIEVKYPTQTNDTINEEYLKDINVKFGEKYGKINSIVLSRSGESDNIYLRDEQSVTEDGLCEVKIVDNQIMNWNNRDEYLQGILDALDGLYYYINDFSSIGILYYDAGDLYNIQIGEKTYQCLMLNDEINITSGIEETIYTETPEQSKTDYTKADKTDRRINQAYVIVNKQQQEIEQLAKRVTEQDGIINENFTQIYQDVTNIVNNVQNSGGNNLIKNSVMFAHDDNNVPEIWEIEGNILPSAYTQLEYIESTGTQYIDTGYKPNGNTKIITELTTKTIPTTNSFFYGARNSVLVSGFGCGLQPYWIHSYGTNNPFSAGGATANTKYKIVQTNNLVVNDIEKYTYETEIFNCNYNLLIFAINNGTSGVNYFSSYKLHNMQMYDNNNLIRNYIPAKRNSDNEIGLYDLVNDIFYVNNGTGNLIAGETIIRELDIQSSSESLNAGAISGHVFILNNMVVKQRIYVKADNSNIPESQKTYYTFSTKIKKNITGTAYVKIYNENEEYRIDIPEGQNPFYSDYEIKNLLPTSNYYDIELYGSTDSDATFTDNMFSVGKYRTQWTQANGEIMNTQVNINVNGVLVKSSIYEGDYTIMSPLEFAGYSKINGIMTKVFSLNKDTTEVEKLSARKQISMPPIKIVPITTGDLQGWAFVPTGEV